MKIWDRLKTSSKWQMGAIGLVWVLGQDWLLKQGISEEQFTNVFMMLLGIMGVQAATDFGKEAKPKE